MKDYKLKIKITKQILKDSMMCGTIDSRKAGNSISKSCAVALAVREVFPNAIVGPSTIRPVSTIFTEIKLPKDATDYILLFDSLTSRPEARLALPEFEFEIRIPEVVINQINLDEVREVLKNSKTLELV